MRLSPERSAELVRAAAGGDQAAWEELVDAYVGLIWRITANHRLRPGDAADVSQTTWLRLLENIDRLQDPARVGAWLATTARRECLRVLGQSRRLVLVTEDDVFDNDPTAPDVDAALLAAERDEDVRAAVRQLSPRCQELLSLLMMDPAPSYEEVAAGMGMPIGSIGPTRGRCLRKLAEMLAPDGIERAVSGIR